MTKVALIAIMLSLAIIAAFAHHQSAPAKASAHEQVLRHFDPLL